jgi:hypothetical protein
MFDELVPPELRPAFRRAWESLRAVDEALASAAALGAPFHVLGGLEGRLQARVALDRVRLSELLVAYRRRELTANDFGRWVEVDLEPYRMLERAGLVPQSNSWRPPPASGRHDATLGFLAGRERAGWRRESSPMRAPSRGDFGQKRWPPNAINQPSCVAKYTVPIAPIAGAAYSANWSRPCYRARALFVNSLA